MPTKTTLKPGDTVAFSQAYVRRCGFDRLLSDVRGVVIGDPFEDNRHMRGKFASVDFPGYPDDDGRTTRTVACANLTRVLSNGAVFGD